MCETEARTQLERPRPRQGIFEDQFWHHVSERALHLQRCDSCASTYYPPGPSCPVCSSAEWTWRPIAGRGVVISWTRFHKRYFPSLPTPYLCVSIALEEGPLLIGNLIGVSRDPVMGEAVRIVYEDCRSGDDAWVIPQWVPAD